MLTVTVLLRYHSTATADHQAPPPANQGFLYSVAWGVCLKQCYVFCKMSSGTCLTWYPSGDSLGPCRDQGTWCGPLSPLGRRNLSSGWTWHEHINQNVLSRTKRTAWNWNSFFWIRTPLTTVCFSLSENICRNIENCFMRRPYSVITYDISICLKWITSLNQCYFRYWY